MQISSNVIFLNFSPHLPLTDVKLKGRPSPRLCQIKPLHCCLTNAGKQQTDSPDSFLCAYHIRPWCFQPLFFPSFLSLSCTFCVNANSGSLSIKHFMFPIKYYRMPSGVRGIISLPYSVCLKTALLIS